MAEPHIISGLKAKQEDLRRRISDLEKRIKETRSDLATITEALRICGDTAPTSKPGNLFKPGELSRIILDALRASDGMDANELTERVMEELALDRSNAALVKKVRDRVGVALLRYHARGHLRQGGIRNRMRIWHCR
ncbi:hypothetical protein JDN40_00675 [Rhodomicrobium vannielii ATCC 17100]|uniref:hypothetical protein n=1 Tax=Rhodomicrobium vannielii TaxID=1069 RepID=UPI0019190BAC|nr:hypothetical protein [Rhodomicrobium vannielii]MBJ7532648.1 hypothetical protein [Rhodomicrobium vannielii ATCC 17100]